MTNEPTTPRDAQKGTPFIRGVRPEVLSPGDMYDKIEFGFIQESL